MYASREASWTPWAFDWDDKMAGVQLLLFELTGEQKYKSDVESFCDYVMGITKSPKGQTHLAQWGSNRYASNFAFICLGVSYFKTLLQPDTFSLGGKCRHQD
jgi:endoglucanase